MAPAHASLGGGGHISGFSQCCLEETSPPGSGLGLDAAQLKRHLISFNCVATSRGIKL